MTKRKRLISVILTAVLVVVVVAPTASATTFNIKCRRSSSHDSSQSQTNSLLSHPPNDEPAMHKGELHSGPDWQACFQDLYVANNVVDNYVSTTADFFCGQNYSFVTCKDYKRVAGTNWRKCSYKSAGWRGSNVGSGEWYGVKVQNTTWYSGEGSCHWGKLEVRERAFAKLKFRDGHYLKHWVHGDYHLALCCD